MNYFAHGREFVDDAHLLASSTPPCGGESPPRRSFLVWFIALVAAVAGLLVGLPVVGYFVGGRRRKIDWVALGPIDLFAIGETRLATFQNPQRHWYGGVVETSVYVRREQPDENDTANFLVLANFCTHAGCCVAWEPESRLFQCPCHGGAFYADGSRASGPPPRGLFHCVWRMREGQLEIRPPHYLTLQAIQTDPSRSE